MPAGHALPIRSMGGVYMKKTLTVLLLVLILIPSFCFAKELSGIKDKILEPIAAVQLGAGYDFFTLKGKYGKHGLTSNRMSALGINLAVTLDLSKIDNFMKEGWFGYFDIGTGFSGKVHFAGSDYNSKTTPKLLNATDFKIHLVIMRRFNFQIPLDVYLGGGLAYNSFTGNIKTYTSNVKLSARAWGIALYAEGDYKFTKHLAVCVSLNPDISFITKLQEKSRENTGAVTINRHTSMEFGLCVTAKASIKYIF